MTRAKISAELDHRVREAAHYRCGYCLSQQQYTMSRLTIEHILPRAVFPLNDPAANAEENLWLSCSFCDGHKSDKTTAVDPQTNQLVPLFNPRRQNWYDHFEWAADGIRVIGLTPNGRATVQALHLNDDPEALAVSANWVSVGWHPPKD